MSRPKHLPIVIPALALRTPSSTESFSTDSSSSTYRSYTLSSTTLSSPSNSLWNSASSQNQMYSNTRPHSRRASPPQTLLGAIDENSGAVRPDVAYSPNNKNNPVTKLHVYSAVFTSRRKPTLATAQPPPDEFAALTGPNGEKFTDLRSNRKPDSSKNNGLKRFMCFG